MRAALLLAACAAASNEGVSYEARIVLQDRVRDMHAHALQAYMDHGYLTSSPCPARAGAGT